MTLFVIGASMGPMLEEPARLALLISQGEVAILVTRPISAGLLAVGLLSR